jgi:hypothetical protein
LLTPGRPIADVDGITVGLVLVELWTSRVTLRLEALRNALTDALDARPATGGVVKARVGERPTLLQAPPQLCLYPTMTGGALSASAAGMRWYWTTKPRLSA